MRSTIAVICGFFCCILFFYAGACFGSEFKKDRSSQTFQDAAELLARLGKKTSDFTTLKTEFIQEKNLALFEDKLVLKGRIYLRKPNMIAWHVDHPVRYSVLITDKLIRQWDAETDKVREISLSKNPVFQGVLGQLTVWFSGEYAGLLKDYAVRIVRQEPVVLECSPRETNISRKVIRNITIAFREDRVYPQKITIHEQNGDTTTINFVNTVVNPLLDESVFEVRPSKGNASRQTGSGYDRMSHIHAIPRARVSG
jgi:outer membrane lipoprotein-sorting protein